METGISLTHSPWTRAITVLYLYRLQKHTITVYKIWKKYLGDAISKQIARGQSRNYFKILGHRECYRL